MSSSNVFDGNIFDGVSEEVTGFPGNTIVDNVRLSKVEYFKGVSQATQSPYECIKMHYVRDENNQKMILTDQVFPLNPDVIKNWQHPVDFETSFKEEKIRYFSRFKHILTKLGVSDDKIQLELGSAKSFIEFAQIFEKLVNEHNTPETKFYLKVNVNSSGYGCLSKYPNFLQNMESGECVLKFSDKEKTTNEKYLSTGKSKTSGLVVEEVVDDFDI